MSFVIRKPRIAERDAVEAAAWYDEREPGLGDYFLNAIDAAVLALAATPSSIAYALLTSVAPLCVDSSSTAFTT
jgi:hypothetical protein